MQHQQRRKRRCAIDSETPEEFIQLATLIEDNDNVYYNEKNIAKVKVLRRSCSKDKENLQPESLVFPNFEGFEHSCIEDASHLQQKYSTKSLFSGVSSSCNLNEEIQQYNIMVMGPITEEFRQLVQNFCHDEADLNDIIDASPLKCQLCLDIAVKTIKLDQNNLKVVKFLLHDTQIQKYETIIDVYIESCEYIVLFLNLEREETLLVEKLKTLKKKIKEPGVKKIISIIMKPHEKVKLDQCLIVLIVRIQ